MSRDAVATAPGTDQTAGAGARPPANLPAVRRRRIDCGSLLVPIPVGTSAWVGRRPAERAAGVHIPMPGGHLRVHVLAAPRSVALWDEVVEDVGAAHRDRGARVVTERGPWGVELVVVAEGELSRFVGVDGPRWLLYGVATGPVAGSQELAQALRATLHGTVVRRGPDPFPARAPLPLTPPDQPSPTAAGVDEARRSAPWQGAVATLHTPSTTPAPAAVEPASRSRSINRDLLAAPRRPANRADSTAPSPVVPNAPVPPRAPQGAPGWTPSALAPARVHPGASRTQPIGMPPGPAWRGREVAYERLAALDALLAAIARYRGARPLLAAVPDRSAPLAVVTTMLNLERDEIAAYLRAGDRGFDRRPGVIG
jgi:hypothetical protein